MRLREHYIMCNPNAMDQLPNQKSKIVTQRSGHDFERRKTFAVEADAPVRLPDIQRSFLSGAGYGSRTRRKMLQTIDFSSIFKDVRIFVRIFAFLVICVVAVKLVKLTHLYYILVYIFCCQLSINLSYDFIVIPAAYAHGC